MNPKNHTLTLGWSKTWELPVIFYRQIEVFQRSIRFGPKTWVAKTRKTTAGRLFCLLDSVYSGLYLAAILLIRTLILSFGFHCWFFFKPKNCKGRLSLKVFLFPLSKSRGKTLVMEILHYGIGLHWGSARGPSLGFLSFWKTWLITNMVVVCNHVEVWN